MIFHLLKRTMHIMSEACSLGALRTHAICHFTSRDMVNYACYFYGYCKLCSIFFLFSGIWDI